MNQPLGVPCSPSGCGSGRYKGGRSSKFEGEVGVVVGICYHCKILRHVNTADENRSYVVAMPLAGEGYPRIVMTFRILFEGGLGFDIFPISGMVGN